ncbi:hypothetical protein MKW92_012152 [Papaver armeniacum]|nr:hypothetical protein MKW92_012152 [Papaver armeniacum]
MLILRAKINERAVFPNTLTIICHIIYVETVLGMKLSYGFALSFFDSENTNNQLKSKSKDLYINSKVYVCGNPKAVVIHVRYRLRKFYRKIHVRHVREFEKKFSGKDVMMINTRRILRPQRPGRSRTLTAVHNAILEDVVYPAEIIGKRIEYRQHGGSKVIKIFLEKNNAEYMLETFSTVYKEPFWERCVVFDA